MNDSKAFKRLEAIFDDGSFTEIDAYAKSANGDVEVVAGFGTVSGCAVYAFSQDVTVDSGAVSTAHCAKIKKIYDLALKTGCPVVGVYDSNGVKLTEGFEVLNAYGELVKLSSQMSGVCPQISVVAGSCLGTSALIANMADVVVAVKDADFYVSAPSEVTAEQSYKEGTVDILADDFDSAVAAVKNLVAVLPSNNLSPAPILDFADASVTAEEGADAMTVISSIADAGSVVELKGGYASSNCKTAIASVMGSAVGFIGFEGKALCPGCSYKAEAMIKLCDAYSIPVVTVVNADGVIGEKENQLLTALTKLTSAYASATCPKISLITGQAIGSAYIILAGKGANADFTFAWDSSIASPLDADAAVAFLYNDRLANGEDREALKNEYKETVASPFTAAACGAVDDVFVPAQTRAKIIAALDILSGKRETTMPKKHSVK
ncbi:MAG: carboxyl transferase domain-containing protein [Eubacteriales bacterium]|nr:carboxyl transferase domain-containing protein [Eubacteriales bacterium]